MSDASKVVLAALLHDIGKMWWPACGGVRPTEVDRYTELLRRDVQGPFTHKHAAYSAACAFRHTGDEELAYLAGSHHYPTTRESWIIAAADRLASGERQRADAEIQTVEAGRSRLASPFSGGWYFPLRPRTMIAEADAEGVIPEQQLEEQQRSVECLWRDLENDLERIGSRDKSALSDINVWFEILREYASFLPAQSPTRIGNYQPDISLFDHCRMTSALAHVLAAGPYDVGALKAFLDDSSTEFGERPFALVTGDLGGIQDFLYTGSTEQAVRSLKGRSFFLDWLLGALCSQIRERLGLPVVCELVSGGGRFTLIAAGSHLDRLPDLQVEVDEALLDQGFARGEVSLVLAGARFGPADLVRSGKERDVPDGLSGIGGVLSDLAGELRVAKQAKYRHLTQHRYDLVFEPFPPLQKRPAEESEAEDSDEQVLDPEMKELGGQLREAAYVVEVVPEASSTYARLGVEPRAVKGLRELHDWPNLRRVVQLNDFKLGKLLEATAGLPQSVVIGSKLVCSQVPLASDGRQVRTFEDLAAEADGDQLLGFLRADVDSLGQLFRNCGTLSRLATLSRMASDYFEGRVTALRSDSKFADKLYVVYSGGDDLFAVGPWDAVLEFAVKLHGDWQDYTSSGSTLSAGIAICHPKFPLRRAAEEAGEAEHVAKVFRRENNAVRVEKNAVCVLGQAMAWDELVELWSLARELASAIVGGSVARAAVQRLNAVAHAYRRTRDELTRQGKRGGDLVEAARWNRWRWLLEYSLRNDFDRTAEDLGRRVHGFLLAKGNESRLGVFARLVIMLARS